MKIFEKNTQWLDFITYLWDLTHRPSIYVLKNVPFSVAFLCVNICKWLFFLKNLSNIYLKTLIWNVIFDLKIFFIKKNSDLLKFKNVPKFINFSKLTTFFKYLGMRFRKKVIITHLNATLNKIIGKQSQISNFSMSLNATLCQK